VKNANQSGGYGMLMGPSSTSLEQEEFRLAIEASPREFIAQPIIPLSCHPTVVGDGLAPRHIDLRPYSAEVDVPACALTRVALQEGSLVVNSSQGGARVTSGAWPGGGFAGSHSDISFAEIYELLCGFFFRS
jgi:uncharacterized circularly permuted ATP-grasp superfamily protein